MADLLLDAQRIGKRYESRSVLDEVSIALEAGQGLLLLGANGAGKTTLLGILCGRVRPDHGTVTVAGIPVAAESAIALSMIGVVGHEPMLHTGLTLRENLVWCASMCGVRGAKQRADSLISEMKLTRQADFELRKLSRGQQQRAGLARALVASPRVLLLDEPFTGLDEPARDWLAAELRSMRARGMAFILTTHETELGLSCADSCALLKNGRLSAPVAAAKAAPLLAEFRERR